MVRRAPSYPIRHSGSPPPGARGHRIRRESGDDV